MLAMGQATRYWFPAKRYGWGWGPPVTWQGWLVLGAYVGLIFLGILIFPPDTSPLEFAAVVVLLTVMLIAVCWLKGEPPRWRWGTGSGEDSP